MTKLAIQHLSKTYADGTEALRDVQVHADSGEIVAILGGSGCGKTTLLRLVAGLDEPSGGVVMVDGAEAVGTHGAISAVFQEPRLLPWLTAPDAQRHFISGAQSGEQFSAVCALRLRQRSSLGQAGRAARGTRLHPCRLGAAAGEGRPDARLVAPGAPIRSAPLRGLR